MWQSILARMSVKDFAVVPSACTSSVECIQQSMDRKCTDRHDSNDELQGASARESIGQKT